MPTRSENRLPRSIVALGLVSLFMDISSEMIHGLLPVFLTVTLGASALAVGLIEGVGEATGHIVKVFSGYWSDRMGRRKPLAVLGYGLSALTKPLFAIATGAGAVMTARFADRVGKGIRGAPRDALVADLVPPAQRGAAYGLRQSLDTVGAVAGPLIAILLMWASGGDIRLVFWLAILPAGVAVLILAFAVREPSRATPSSGSPRPRLDRASLAALGPAFWRIVGVGALLTLARVSEAFLILRATDAGLALALAPLVLVAMNAVYAATAWPAGTLADRRGKRRLLRAGFAVLALAHLLLALGDGLPLILSGVLLWGLHMGLTQGLLAAEVADNAPDTLRGTAFGVFNLVSGVALLLGNGVAGAVWAGYGPAATFGLAAALAGAGTALLVIRDGGPRPQPPSPAARSKL